MFRPGYFEEGLTMRYMMLIYSQETVEELSAEEEMNLPPELRKLKW